MQFHELSEIFPLLDGEELESLTNDIRERGLREKIVLYEGKILDGRNRFRACQAAGVEPKFREYRGKDALGEGISLNLQRRHLSESQRAMVAARLANLPNGVRKDRVGAQICAPNSQPEAAQKLRVARRSVQNAKAVLERGTPDLIAAVDSGTIPVSVAADLSRLPSSVQSKGVSGGIAKAKQLAKAAKQEATEKSRAARTEKLASQADASLPDKRFAVIYADPPWRYEHCEDEGRSIERNYPTMTLEEIKCLPVTDRTADAAILFLWATSPKLAEAMEVMSAWGFSYRTNMVWIKDKIGMGYYARQRHELILIGTRGSMPTPSTRNRPDSVITAPRKKHSAKPVEARMAIERMYPTLPKLELFCREPAEGWSVWGFES